MSEYSHETLRTLFRRSVDGKWNLGMLEVALELHADAWEEQTRKSIAHNVALAVQLKKKADWARSLEKQLASAEAQIDILDKRLKTRNSALNQCERALRMPWLNTYEESQKALELIDATWEEAE
jgi:hypothetical protein